MEFATILLLGVGVWVGILWAFIALCKAAKLGDEAIQAAYREATRRRQQRRHADEPQVELAAGRAAGVPRGQRR
jgi:hypothetical protein